MYSINGGRCDVRTIMAVTGNGHSMSCASSSATHIHGMVLHAMIVASVVAWRRWIHLWRRWRMRLRQSWWLIPLRPRRSNTKSLPEPHDGRCNIDIDQVVLHSDLMSKSVARESGRSYQLFEVERCFRVNDQVTFHRPRTWTLSGVTMFKDRKSDRKKEWSWTLTVYKVQHALERRYMFHEIFLDVFMRVNILAQREMGLVDWQPSGLDPTRLKKFLGA